MADSSINLIQSYLLNGKKFNAPIEWKDVEIVAEYEGDSVQPTITIDSFNFNLEARKEILKWIVEGNIFEGLPVQINLNNINQQSQDLNGYLDFEEGYSEFLDDGTVECSFVQTDGLDSFFNKIDVVSYGYLESIGVISSSDYKSMDYVVEKKFNALEIIMTSIMVYLMIKELQESIMRLADNIASIASYLASGLTGSVGAGIYRVASAIINVIYTAAMVIAIKNMVTSLFEFLLPPRREHKVISIKRILEVVCNYYGYGLELKDSFLENVHYLPSNINVDEVSKLGNIKTPRGTLKGIPNVSDVGYNCGEMFQLAKTLIDGKFAIINKIVHLRPVDDVFWLQQSTYEMPDVLIRKREYNLSELNSTILISFLTDITDEYTIDNYKGTSIEIKTDVISAQNQNRVLLKGFNEINVQTALGTRKDKLNALETALKSLAELVDSVTDVLGGGSNFANKVKSRIGLLKVSNNYNSIPKLLYLNGSSIPSNHRDFLSAESIWRKYYGDKSFVRDSFKSQKLVYDSVEDIPFGLESFKKLLNNSYFYRNGKDAKIKRIAWKLSQDKANIDFWERGVYTRNLKETEIIPE